MVKTDGLYCCLMLENDQSLSENWRTFRCLMMLAECFGHAAHLIPLAQDVLQLQIDLQWRQLRSTKRGQLVLPKAYLLVLIEMLILSLLSVLKLVTRCPKRFLSLQKWFVMIEGSLMEPSYHSLTPLLVAAPLKGSHWIPLASPGQWQDLLGFPTFKVVKVTVSWFATACNR